MERIYSPIIGLIVLTFLFNVTSAQAQDTTRPTVEIGAPSDVQGTGTFDITITFSESVTGFSHTALTLTPSNPRNSATATTGTGSQYTVTINIGAPENDKWRNRYNLNIQVPKEVAHDSANNGNTKSQIVTVPIDTGRPVVLIGAAETQVGPSFVVEIDFAEPVTGFRFADVKVFTKPEGSPVYHPDWRSEWRREFDNATYSVRITPQFGDRDNITVHFQVDDNVAEDAAGNPNYGGKRHVFVFRPDPPQDNVRPTAFFTVPTEKVTGPSFDASITFSEPVTGLTPNDISLRWISIQASELDEDDRRQDLNQRPLGALLIRDWTAHPGGTHYSFVVVVPPAFGEGQVRLTIFGDVAEDAAGNGNLPSQVRNGGAIAGVNIDPSTAADNTRPTVTITPPMGTQTEAFDVTITFSEIVFGFTQSDFSVSGAGASITSWSKHDNFSEYGVEITPTRDGTVRFNIPARVAQDQVGNLNTAATELTVTVDIPDPPSISASISAPSSAQHGAFNAIVTFTQAVTGFEQSELSVSGAGASVTAWNPQTGGQRYTATITPTKVGEVELSVAANVATETHGAAIAVTVVIWPEDVNRDGYIDSDDLFLVASHFGRDPTGGRRFYDVNRDGNIDTSDFRQVVAWLWRPVVLGSAAPTAAVTSHEWLQRIKALNIEDPEFQELLQSLEQQLPMPAPKATALLANYPNPFNPETWIPYRLAKSADVTVTIYAANGEIIRSLPLGHRPAGNYLNRARAAYWDGKNALGEPVASGIYFYTLTAGNFSTTRKMLIAK